MGLTNLLFKFPKELSLCAPVINSLLSLNFLVETESSRGVMIAKFWIPGLYLRPPGVRSALKLDLSRVGVFEA